MRIIVRPPCRCEIAFPGDALVERISRRRQHVLAADDRDQAELGIEPGGVLHFRQEFLAAHIRQASG